MVKNVARIQQTKTKILRVLWFAHKVRLVGNAADSKCEHVSRYPTESESERQMKIFIQGRTDLSNISLVFDSNVLGRKIRSISLDIKTS